MHGRRGQHRELALAPAGCGRVPDGEHVLGVRDPEVLVHPHPVTSGPRRGGLPHGSVGRTPADHTAVRQRMIPLVDNRIEPSSAESTSVEPDVDPSALQGAAGVLT